MVSIYLHISSTSVLCTYLGNLEAPNISRLCQVCGHADHNGLYPYPANELQESNFGDGGTGGAQTVNLER